MSQDWPTKEWTEYLKLVRERPELFRQDERLSIVFDEGEVKSFVSRTGKTIGVAYRSPYNLMVVDLVRAPGGEPFAYERLVAASTGSTVVTIPCYQGQYALLRQFRHSLRGEQYAFPRGFGEDGLSAEENASKELEEELGAHTLSAVRLGKIVADSGLSGGGVAVVLSRIERPTLKKDYEGIQAVTLADENAMRRMIASGEINDGYTLAAWTLLQTYQSQS